MDAENLREVNHSCPFCSFSVTYDDPSYLSRPSRSVTQVSAVMHHSVI